MKNAFIERYRHAWPVSVQCRVLQVSAARYHAHLARRASDAPRQRLSDEALLVHIKALHAETRSAYGWPRIWRELVARGVPVGKQRVQKLMQLRGIRAKGKRRFKVTTDSNHKLPISPNFATTASSAWLLWNNKARLHSTLAYVSPMQFKSEWLAKQASSGARLWDTQSRGKVSHRTGRNDMTRLHAAGPPFWARAS